MGAGPGGGVVDVRAGVDGLRGRGEVAREDGDGKGGMGFLEAEGCGEAYYAGAGGVSMGLCTGGWERRRDPMMTMV